MAHDVFISYSSRDKPVADAVCATLEAHGVRCWIAPRDVLAGEEYAASLVGGLSNSRLMVLVFSARSNQSPQVLREVERAVSKGLPILPLRIEDVPMSPAMEYYISSRHWLDAITPPLERHLARLRESVQALLARPQNDAPEADGKTTPAAPANGSTAAAPEIAVGQQLPREGWQAAAAGGESAQQAQAGPQGGPVPHRTAGCTISLSVAFAVAILAAGIFYLGPLRNRPASPLTENVTGDSAAPASFRSLDNQLLAAAASGDAAAAARLLGQGAYIEGKDNQGNTALLLAAKRGRTDTAKLLLEKGANIEAKDNQGNTALSAACTAGHDEVAQLLVEKGAEINARDEAGATPLMYAALAGSTAALELLLAKGADVNAQDENGETPLMYAASAGNADAVKLLLRNRANKSVKDRNGETALQYATKWKRSAAVRLLGQ